MGGLLKQQPGSILQFGDNVRFKPGILFEPSVISRAGMRQDKFRRPVFPPVFHDLGDRKFGALFEVPVQSVSSYN